MPSRRLLMIACLIAMVLSACSLKPQYTTLEAQLEDSRTQKSQAKNRLEFLENELTESERKLQVTAAELKDSREAGNNCAKALKDFQAQNTYLKNINLQLSENIKILKLELNKKKSVTKTTPGLNRSLYFFRCYTARRRFCSVS
jgi:septal ring factor EnvC (AmiA/AmiB activator)